MVLFASFLLGLMIDIFSDSGGVHATACLMLAYFRPVFLRFAFGLSYEYQTIRIADKLTVDRFTFIMTSILFHHIILFTLEFYRLSLFFNIILHTLLSTLFTFLICIISIYLIKSNKSKMRKTFLPTLIIVTAVILILRLFYLQVIDDTLKIKSENNAIKIKYDFPERGYIYDRYGKLLVANQPSYDIMVVPNEIKRIDTLEFCSILDITKKNS